MFVAANVLRSSNCARDICKKTLKYGKLKVSYKHVFILGKGVHISTRINILCTGYKIIEKPFVPILDIISTGKGKTLLKTRKK